MRVIAGQYRGRTLVAPKGTLTRPTTERVRESLFSSLISQSGGFEDAWVLDAFAGSGALGIEALSRGATFALFCEKHPSALDALSRNTSFLADDSFRIVRGDVMQRNIVASHPYTMVFLDPPYATDPTCVARILERLSDQDALDENVIVSYEHDIKSNLPLLTVPSSLEWRIVSTKTFGDTAIDLYRRA